MRKNILVFGANGQIGTELVEQLRSNYSENEIIACDIKSPDFEHQKDGPFEYGNVLDLKSLRSIFQKYRPVEVYHLAALLSAIGEQKPKEAWQLNMEGLLNVLDLAAEFKTSKVFWPSSIAIFGPTSPKYNTPQFCSMEPTTAYGISKLAGERWCEYYYIKYGLDVRSIRYPGLMGWKAEPGGGTTDYAVHVFQQALRNGSYDCFLKADTEIPMMYMPDAIRATLELMDTSTENLSIRSGYNISGISFTPEMLAEEIKKHIPEFQISYQSTDPRQQIADSWPKSIDDSLAQKDWGWNSEYDLKRITEDMLQNLKK